MTNQNNSLRIWMEQRNAAIPLLFFQHYKELAITDEESLVVLHLHAFQTEGIEFPTPYDLTMRMHMQVNMVSNHLQRLMQKGFLEITQGVDSSGKLAEKYSLFPLWERIVHFMEMKQQTQQVKTLKEQEGEIFRMFEEELGRLLSPIELETIGQWMDVDKQSPAIIKMALKEAVLAGKVNLRYIDRILFEWKKKNVQTPQDVKKQTEQFRQNITPQKTNTPPMQPTAKVPFYNWLEERE